MGIPDHLTSLLRNLYAGQEATVRTGHGTPDWFQIGKEFNLYAEYIIRNARLDEAQAGIKIARRNINNLIYAEDTSLMVESKGELNSLLMRVKPLSTSKWTSFCGTCRRDCLKGRQAEDALCPFHFIFSPQPYPEDLVVIFLPGAPCNFEVKIYVPCVLGEEDGKELGFSLVPSQYSH